MFLSTEIFSKRRKIYSWMKRNQSDTWKLFDRPISECLKFSGGANSNLHLPGGKFWVCGVQDSDYSLCERWTVLYSIVQWTVTKKAQKLSNFWVIWLLFESLKVLVFCKRCHYRSRKKHGLVIFDVEDISSNNQVFGRDISLNFFYHFIVPLCEGTAKISL